MSEWQVKVIEVTEDNLRPHDNADALELVYVDSNYPVVVRKGQFKPGDTAVHVALDSVVPVDKSYFSFLDNGKPKARIKPKKLRGILSYGMLIENEFNDPIGTDVAEKYGVEKYEEESHLNLRNGMSNKDPHLFSTYDLDAMRKYAHLIPEGTPIYVTEKVHGTNASFVYSSRDDEFYVKSHRRFRKDVEGDVWWGIAKQYNLPELLKNELPDMVVQGEIYGRGIQNLTYGKNKPELAVFDILDLSTSEYLLPHRRVRLATRLGLPVVPVIDPFKEYQYNYDELIALAENMVSTYNGELLEGLVVEPLHAHIYHRGDRVKLKIVSEKYLNSK